MVRKLQFLFIALLVSCAASAQITITSESFPAPGDTLRTAFDAMPSDIDLLEQGADKTWDFTSLAGISQETVIRNANEGQYTNQFPTADILIGNPDGNTGEFYYNKTDNLYELLGYVGPDPADFGINVIAKLSPPSPERRAPLNFIDFNNSSYNIEIAFSTDLIPGNILDSFPVAPDSLRILISNQRLDAVDAWGTLTIPEGTYDVLREKREQERETRLEVYAGVGPFGQWFDVTDIIGFDFLGKDTTITYNFFSNDAKEAIAEVTVDPETNDPISVTYKSNEVDDPTSSMKYVDQGRADIFAYPNPAINDVRFDFINLPTDTYDLKIYNILGVEVYSQEYSITDRKTVKMDLSRMRKGTYLYSLVDSRGKPVTTKRLVVMKP
ncbi:MAG: T9SS type A sorting domain-containing protein [Saprospiraceae bacterium]